MKIKGVGSYSAFPTPFRVLLTRSFPSARAVGWIKKIYIKKYLGVVNIFLSREKNI
jgi:hypothetical protein